VFIWCWKMIFTKRSGWSGSCVLVGGLGNLFPGRTVFDKNIHRRVLSETNEFLRRASTREFYAKRMAFSLQTFFFLWIRIFWGDGASTTEILDTWERKGKSDPTSFLFYFYFFNFFFFRKSWYMRPSEYAG